MLPMLVLVSTQLAALFGALAGLNVTGPQLLVPSLMVTVPVGFCVCAATLTLTVYGWPTKLGAGVCEVMVVVVGS